jgi:hypothetical protein
MKDINSLVLEAFNTEKPFISSVNKDPYRELDEDKIKRLSKIHGISDGISSHIQKISGPMGGANKFLGGRYSGPQTVDIKDATEAKIDAVKHFNNMMGEKVL